MPHLGQSQSNAGFRTVLSMPPPPYMPLYAPAIIGLGTPGCGIPRICCCDSRGFGPFANLTSTDLPLNSCEPASTVLTAATLSKVTNP